MSEIVGVPYQLPVTIRKIPDVDRSGVWLRRGWQDFLKAPGISLVYGVAFVVAGLAIVFGLRWIGLDSLVLPLAAGFVLIAPLLVVGLYDVSRRLELGERPRLSDVFGAVGAHLGQLSIMGVALLVCYLVWIRVALLLFAVFFGHQPPSLEEFLQNVVFSISGVPLLIVGSLVGAFFAAIVFSISAVSVPMIYDRDVDAITAISASLLAVKANWRLMFGWAALIALITFCCMLTLFVGLAVAVPVLGYATWHCYRDLIGPAEEG